MGMKTSEILALISAGGAYDGSEAFETEFTLPYHTTNVVDVNTEIVPDLFPTNSLWMFQVETQCMNGFGDAVDNGLLRYAIRSSAAPGLPTAQLNTFSFFLNASGLSDAGHAMFGETSQFSEVLNAAPANRIHLNASGELVLRFKNNILSPHSTYMKFKVTSMPVRQLPFFPFDLP